MCGRCGWPRSPGCGPPAGLPPLIAVQQAMFGANAAVGGAVVPRLVPSGLLPAANALQSMSVWFAGIAGPLLAGVLMPLVGARMLFMFDAIAMCPTLWAIIRLPALPSALPPALPPTGQDAAARAGRARGRQVADGFRYLARHRILLVAYAVDFVTLFFGLPTALFPQIAHQRFGGQARAGRSRDRCSRRSRQAVSLRLCWLGCSAARAGRAR
jgi:hypothetical protein